MSSSAQLRNQHTWELISVQNTEHKVSVQNTEQEYNSMTGESYRN